MTHVIIARSASKKLLPLLLVIACASVACAGVETPIEETTVDTTTVDAGTPDAGPTEPDAGEPPPPPPPPPPCVPTAGGPHSLLEGETLTVQVRCSSDRALTGDSFTFVDLPAGATYEPATATLSWTPGLDAAGHYTFVLAAPKLDESTVVRVAVADRWEDPANLPIVDPTAYTEEFGLPVLHLTTDPGLNDDEYTDASIVYRGHTYEAEAKLRGSFSRSFPKRSFTLKFAKDDRFNDPDAAGGFLKKRKITVISTFDDNSHLRQRLGYHLWNRLGPDHIKVQAYNAVVYLNGRYHGLYVLADHVDDDLMESHGLSKDGNLYKARDHDANFRLTDQYGAPKLTLHQGYTKEEGTPEEGEPGAFDDLDALVEWVATSDSETFLAEIDERLERRDYEDWWIFVSAIMADDSVGKNSHHFHDPEGGPWRAIPWDLNHSFGQTWETQRIGPTERNPANDYIGQNELFRRILAEPTLAVPLQARYGMTLRGEFDANDLVERLDTWAAEIDKAARRDEAKWGPAHRGFAAWSQRDDFTTWEEEVTYVRGWIAHRFAWLEELY